MTRARGCGVYSTCPGVQNAKWESWAATVGQDGWAVGEARPLLLVDAGGEPSDAATVWEHGAADRRAAVADWIGRGGEGEPNRAKEGGDGEVPEKSFNIRHFRGFPYWK